MGLQGRQIIMAGMVTYIPNKIYNRGEIHAAAKDAGGPPGNDTAGITVVGDDQCVFWNPFRPLYANRWIEEPDEFIYSGEGSVGPMQYVRGNLQLRDCHDSGRPVLVFYKVQRTGSHWLHLGSFTVADIYTDLSLDTKKVLRQDIRFHFLRNANDVISPPLPKIAPAAPPAPRTEAELWELASTHTAAADGKRKRETITSRNRRVSNPALTAYVVQRAIDNGGACESCGVVPDWTDVFGRPHFQAHHIDPDIDRVDWIGAICGTCHDRLHHGRDREQRAQSLRETVRARQLAIGREVTEPDRGHGAVGSERATSHQ
ncbi:hypothetical protein BJ973_007417 [Actinoplanes tereljensis]|uniref:ScoMcrA-like SRA domain-containing protein n=1 Tax=Paractinoplanes tereljensis TaxID=571912 RepID=A0A919NTY4_9ACTN|nr:hypothetical protein [Actinoplanes tereljensis]GIF25164.1 hypothetical protein Ate02nite_78940 [Actinoplanes tereljensis]